MEAANSTDRDRLPSFSPRSGELRLAGRLVRLEPRSAALLEQLQAANGEVLTRQELLDCCWEPGGGSDEALTQAIAQIRRAFEELGINGAVETLAKRGYRLKVGFRDQQRLAGPGQGAPNLRLPLIISGLLLVAVLVISFSHPARHAVRHALGLGPSQSVAAQHRQP